MGSGTNAPLYTTNFTATATKNEDEAESLADIIAKALDLDRAQRVFKFVDSNTPSRTGSTGTQKHEKLIQKTSWNGTEWVQDGLRSSESYNIAQRHVSML